MKGFIKKTVIPILLIVFTTYIIINPYCLIHSVEYSTELFVYNIFPTLFPFFIISEFLTNYKITYIIGKALKKIVGNLFKISEEESFAFLLSIFSGQPSNAKYIKDLLDNKKTSLNNASNLLCYTFFPSPMFIIGTIGILFYDDINIGYIILISVYVTNIILGIFFRNKNEVLYNNISSTITLPFGELMQKSITNAFNTLILILGSMTIFIILTNTIISMFNFNFYIETFINSFLEITGGCKKISLLEISLNLKIILTCFILSFGGFCIHSQVKSILYNYKFEYKKVIFFRLLASIISLIISYVLIFII